MSRVLIIGAGRIGKAVGYLISQDSNNEVNYWDKVPGLVSDQGDLGVLVKEADFIFVAVSSWNTEDVLEKLKSDVSDDVTVVSLTKGILPSTKEFSYEYLDRYFGEDRFAVISGPMMAEDLLKDQGSTAMLAGKEGVTNSVSVLFGESCLKLKETTDVIGVSISGVLKNVYASGLAMAEAVGVGPDYYRTLTHESLEEMKQILKKFDGDPNIIDGPAGKEDLILTISSSDSRNRKSAREFIEKGKVSKQSEGMASVKFLVERLKRKTNNLPPFLSAIYNILEKGANVKEEITSLFI